VAALVPTALSRAGWKAYANTQLHVALDYPAAWSVHEETTGITFSSPQGPTIQLARVDTGGLSPEDYMSENLLPNTRCSSPANEHGLTIQVCLDTLSLTRVATFIINSSGTPQLLSLVAGRRSDLAVFNTMVASLRALP
jgi:hypothetical protein